MPTVTISCIPTDPPFDTYPFLSLWQGNRNLSTHRYVFESKDVVSGKPMMRAFIDALTQPLTDSEKYKGTSA
jgi:hypothetical protein